MNGLLVGGSSCVGKTTLCRNLAAELGFVHVESDRSLPTDSRLRPLDGSPRIWDLCAGELCQRLIRAAEAAIPYLTSLAEAMSSTTGRWVIEGEVNACIRLWRGG